MNLMIAIALYCIPAPNPHAAMQCQKYLIQCTAGTLEAPEKKLRECLTEENLNSIMCEK